MSLLTMIQQALKEIGEFEVPATIISNTNPTATQFLALAQREGRELSRRHHWQALVTEKTQTLTNGTEGYDLRQTRGSWSTPPITIGLIDIRCRGRSMPAIGNS